MNTRRLLVFVALVTCGPQGSYAAETWIAQFDRVGPLRIGMSVPELSRVLRERIRLPADPRERECMYVETSRPKGLALMIVDGRLVRIDIRSRNVATTEGARVGDLEKDLVRLYGPRVQVTPHHYTAPEGTYLTIRANSGTLGMRFETYQGRVFVFYVGEFPQIEYVEQCL
jgi:hypothetical protein